MCLDFHPSHESVLAVGCYDGTVLVFDIRNKLNKPIFSSTVKTGKHSDPVWEVAWLKDDGVKSLNFFSISSDGRVTLWTLSKNELQHSDIMLLKLAGLVSSESDGQEETSLVGLAGGCCMDLNSFTDHLFLVGTEEGRIHKCSKAYNSQYLETYEGHFMAIYAVRWNKLHPRVFLSASADWTVKLWDHESRQPLMSFDLGNAVGDVEWAPYSSTVFAAVTNDGKVHVFDLAENKHEAMCDQKVVRKSKVTHVAFNPNPASPILLVGDDRGGVLALKLSPNLRRTQASKKNDAKASEVKAPEVPRAPFSSPTLTGCVSERVSVSVRASECGCVVWRCVTVDVGIIRSCHQCVACHCVYCRGWWWGMAQVCSSKYGAIRGVRRVAQVELVLQVLLK